MKNNLPFPQDEQPLFVKNGCNYRYSSFPFARYIQVKKTRVFANNLTNAAFARSQIKQD